MPYCTLEILIPVNLEKYAFVTKLRTLGLSKDETDRIFINIMIHLIHNTIKNQEKINPVIVNCKADFEEFHKKYLNKNSLQQKRSNLYIDQIVKLSIKEDFKNSIVGVLQNFNIGNYNPSGFVRGSFIFDSFILLHIMTYTKPENREKILSKYILKIIKLYEISSLEEFVEEYINTQHSLIEDLTNGLQKDIDYHRMNLIIQQQTITLLICILEYLKNSGGALGHVILTDDQIDISQKIKEGFNDCITSQLLNIIEDLDNMIIELKNKITKISNNK